MRRSLFLSLVVCGVLAGSAAQAAGTEKLTEQRLVAEDARFAQDGGRFKERCGNCHGKVDTFAQKELVLVDGRLQGRYSGRDVAAYLLTHATRSQEEAAFFEHLLRGFTTTVR
jgi:hypothetical protein